MMEKVGRPALGRSCCNAAQHEALRPTLSMQPPRSSQAKPSAQPAKRAGS
jgi:hypothetical protein